jgi:hypothetical protein
MGASVILYRGIEKIINNRELDFDGKKERIADLFINSGSMVPEELIDDLFIYYVDSGFGDNSGDVCDSDQLRDLAYHLVDVVDLFSLDYDNVKDSLSIDEWITIKDLFSAYAEKIDDELLTYVMRCAVENGAFRSS